MLVRLCLLSSVLAGVLAASGTTPNNSCLAYRCGHGHAVAIRYPLWIAGGVGDADANGTSNNSSRCGYIELGLECRRGTPVLPLPSGEYAVTNIHYSDRTMSLVDLGASGNGSCPVVAGRNLTLPPPLALTRRNTNLTFLLNCNFSDIDDRYLAPCLENGTMRSYVLRDGTISIPYERAELCQQVVGMPVLHPADDVVPALRAGFEVSWRQAVGGQCGRCENAGGFCGQRREVAHWIFTCIHTTPTTKTSGRRKTSARIIIIIVVIVFIMLAGCVGAIWAKKCQANATP